MEEQLIFPSTPTRDDPCSHKQRPLDSDPRVPLGLGRAPGSPPPRPQSSPSLQTRWPRGTRTHLFSSQRTTGQRPLGVQLLLARHECWCRTIFGRCARRGTWLSASQRKRKHPPKIRRDSSRDDRACFWLGHEVRHWMGTAEGRTLKSRDELRPHSSVSRNRGLRKRTYGAKGLKEKSGRLGESRDFPRLEILR